MVSTIPLEEFEKHADNIYEAIVVIAKRARQVNDSQKRYLEQELGFGNSLEGDAADELEDTDGLRDERKIEPGKFIRLTKPPTVALDEMIAGKLEFHYAEGADHDGPKPVSSRLDLKS